MTSHLRIIRELEVKNECSECHKLKQKNQLLKDKVDYLTSILKRREPVETGTVVVHCCEEWTGSFMGNGKGKDL